MRFTRIPLIATLLAGALSLLVVLPAIAQSTQGVETDGRQSVGGALEVQVYQNIADIRARGIAAADADSSITMDAATGNNQDATGRGAPEGATTDTIARGDQALGLKDSSGDDAFDFSRVPDPRNTYFNGRLYVSNDDDAYNTVLITAQVPGGASSLESRTNRADDVNTPADETIDDGWNALLTYNSADVADCAIAKAKNSRSGKEVDVALLAVGGIGDGTINSGHVYQGVLTVWDRGTDRVEDRNAPCTNLPFADPVLLESVPDGETPWSVTDTTNNQPAAILSSRDGDTIEITVAGVRGRLTLTVDGDEPTLTGLTPENGGTTNSSRVTLGFTVSDDGAGMRFDAEDGLSGDGDSSPANGDGDQRYNEPLTSGTQGAPGTGATEDIQIYYNPGSLTDGDMGEDGFQFNPSQEFSFYGTSGWTEVALGRTYRLAMVLNSQSFNKYEWQVVAKDRVGNAVTTDGDDDEDDEQPFTFSLDNEDPVIREVRTGVKFDSSSSPPREKADRSWIALSIVNEDDGGDDRVDRSSVQASDFTVSGATVVDAVVPTTKKKCEDDDPDTTADETKDNVKDIDGECMDFDPRARIYLQLSAPLEADETPTVQTLGGVFQDVAGNNNKVESLSGSSDQVKDRIDPGVTVTVTATGEATNRAATNDDGEFTIRVTSDEDLRSFPKVWFATIDGVALGDSGADAAVGTMLGVAALDSDTPRELERNVWETTVDKDEFPGSGSRLVAVLVRAEDENGNAGNSDGWTLAQTGGSGEPVPGTYDHDSDDDTDERPRTRLDFKKLDDGGFLIEVDRDDVSAPTVSVQPPAEGETRITESLTPYVQLNFNHEDASNTEANEYGIDNRDDADDAPSTFYKADAGEDEDAIKTDSHEGIELTKLTVDGVDRLEDVRRVGSSKGSFIIAFVEGLSIGKHDVVYAATDDIGNELPANSAGDREGEFSFTIRSRAGYKVSLRPGWNLISFPGTPENPAVSAVLDGMEANTVLSYQEGEWLSAIRPDGGEWQGTLEQIVGGYGYWVQTTAAETITTVIPPTLPNQVLPTVPITSGWNLVGVIDAAQRATTAANAAQDPDKYFVNVSWRVAYGFATQGSQWVKILPKPSGTDDGTNNTAIRNGSGYWLWSTEPGVLVP